MHAWEGCWDNRKGNRIRAATSNYDFTGGGIKNIMCLQFVYWFEMEWGSLHYVLTKRFKVIARLFWTQTERKGFELVKRIFDHVLGFY